ncbi:hypothetical protein BGX27_000211 [Mortierella sp. AM989]|nr:hypothetical protein BGX27_000211 [Mortierella sp. AM989]
MSTQKIVRLNHPNCFCGRVATAIFPAAAEPTFTSVATTTTTIATITTTSTTSATRNSTAAVTTNTIAISTAAPTSHPVSYERSRSSSSSSPQDYRPKQNRAYGAVYGQTTPSASSPDRHRKSTKYAQSTRAFQSNWVYECHYTPLQSNSSFIPPDSISSTEIHIDQWSEKDMDFEKFRTAQMKAWSEVAARSSDSGMETLSNQNMSSEPVGTMNNYYLQEDVHSTSAMNGALVQEPSSPIESSLSSTSSSSSSSSVSLSSSLSSSLSTIRESRESDSATESKFTEDNSRNKQPRSPSPIEQALSKDLNQVLHEDIQSICLEDAFFATATRFTPQQKGKFLATTISTATASGASTTNMYIPSTFAEVVKENTGPTSEVWISPPVAAVVTELNASKTLASEPPEFPAAVSKSPVRPWNPEIKVCGFHMHALEWHRMENLKTSERIILAERAQCPIFNLSLTRWLQESANDIQKEPNLQPIDPDHLQKESNYLRKEPFNTIECLCGDPMVIASDITSGDQGCYDLVCPKSLPAYSNLSNQDTRMDFTGNRQKGLSRQRIGQNSKDLDSNDPEIAQSGKEQKKPREPCQPCSKVVRLSEALYSPRFEPVHTSIPNDEWLDRCFLPRPTRRSFYAPNCSPFRKKGEKVKSILNQVATYYPKDYSKFNMFRQKRPGTVRFRVRPVVILSTESPEFSTENNNSNDGKSEWPIPDWCKQSMSISDSILDSDSQHYTDLWSGEKLQDLDKWDVFEVPKNLIEFSAAEAVKDAKKYADQYKQKVKIRLEERKVREEEVEMELEKAWAERARMATEINTMDRNGLEMPHKCRICYDRVLTHAVLPCYHLVMCESCAYMVNECVVCRVRKTGLRRIYWG